MVNTKLNLISLNLYNPTHPIRWPSFNYLNYVSNDKNRESQLFFPLPVLFFQKKNLDMNHSIKKL